MKKLWLVAKQTYKQRVRSGSFLMLTFALPVLMVIAGAIPVLQMLRQDVPPVGLVDQTGQLEAPERIALEREQTLVITPYTDTAAAEAAIGTGEVAGYLLVPGAYFDGESPRYVGEEAPSEMLRSGLEQLLREAMLPDAPDWQLARLENPTRLTYVSQESGQSISEGPGLLLWIGLPVAMGILFAFMVFTNSSQLGQAVVKEKDRRAMEMIITSMRARDLIVGKVLGMTLLSLTQIGVWLAGAGIALGLALAGNVSADNLLVPWYAVVWALVLGVPGYFLYAVLAAGLGVIAGSKEQAQQMAGLLGFIGLAPMWLFGLIVQNPDGPLAVGLTVFPLTSPIVALLRMVFTEVPVWQLAAAEGLIVVFLLAGIWAVTRIFRAAMLMYGQALTPRQIWQALQESVI